VATLDENCYAATIDEEKNIFYALSQHYMYKGDLKTGEILDRYKFMDIIEKTENDYVDPNLFIIPREVTTNGYAIVEFNPRKLEASRNMKKYSDILIKGAGDAVFDVAAESEENNEIYAKESKTEEFYLIDFNKKSKTHYATYNLDEVTFVGLNESEAISYNKYTRELVYEDFLSGTEKKKISYAGFFNQHAALKELKTEFGPRILKNDVVNYRFNDTINQKFIDITFNSKTNEILTRDEILYKNIIYQGKAQLLYLNSEDEGIYFANAECNIPSQPEMQELPEMKGTSAKKLAAWQEEVNKIQEEYKKKSEEWIKQTQQRENFCTLHIFGDQTMTQKLISIPKAEKGTIVNKDKVLITRANEVALYDLNTGTEVWTIDTNF